MFLPLMQEEDCEQIKKLLLCLSLPAYRGENPPLPARAAERIKQGSLSP